MTHFGTGDLVWFEDLNGELYLSVILEDGVSGYGVDTRIIYVIYSIVNKSTWLAYESEIFAIDEKSSFT